MFTFGKSRTEEQQALSQKRAVRIQTERDDAEQEIAEQKERQRAQRLAKALADKKAAG